MASRIKGITIELGADTTSLEGALSDVNKQSKNLQKELKDVEKLLKFNPNNTELLAQKQELLTRNISATTDKLNQLRQAEQQVQAQFERGDIAEEQYRAFQREIADTEASLNTLRGSLQNMQREQDKVAEGTRRLSTLFDATESSVEDYADALGDRLVRSIQNGTANSRDLEQAFQRIGRQAIGAGGDIEQLRASIQSLDNGSTLETVRRDLQRISQEAEEAEQSFKDLDIGIENVAGALAVGGGLSGIIEKSLDASTLNTKINLTMDLSDDSKEVVKGAIRTIEAYGVDGEAALEGVRRQWVLNKGATDEANASVVKMAGTIASSYAGIDFNELIQENNEIAAALKISNEEAIALTNALLKAGFPPEQLDTISEYGTQMQMIGFNTREIQSIFEQGISTKTWNIDNLNDGVKEARLQMATFGSEVPKAIQPLIETTGISVEKFQNWGEAVAAGGEKGSKAMAEVATWLDGIEDKTVQNELATAAFGTKWEDQGPNMIAVFQGLSDAVDKTKQNTEGLNTQMQTLNEDPAIQMKQAFSDMLVALAPLLISIANFIAQIGQWISKNPELSATILAIVTAAGLFLAGLLALLPVIVSLTGATTAMGVAVGILTSPITLTIAAIAALIAIGVALWANWDTISSKAVSLWNKLGPFQSLFIALTGPIGTLISWGVKLYQNWDTIKEKADALRKKIAGLFDGISWKLPDIKLPHFSFKNWSVNPVDWIKAKPSIDIDWYDKGGIFTGPQVIGVGEKRPEFVGALDDLYAIVKNAMYDVVQIENGKSQPQQVVTQKQQPNIVNINSDGMLNGAVFQVREEADIQKIAKQLNEYIKQSARKGGVIIAN